MTNEELDKIERRANAATPGPWKYCADSDAIKGTNALIVRGARPNSGPFIAHARADVPALIARVRELEERLEQRTRERDHERAIVANGCFTYSEGEVALRAQAAEAQQLAKQMMDERDDARTQLSMTQAWHEQMCRSSEKGWAEVEMLRERVTEHQRKFEAGWSVLRKQRDEARAEVEQRGLYIEEIKRDLIMVDDKNGALGAEVERLRELLDENAYERGLLARRMTEAQIRRDELGAEVERLTAEVEVLRGVGCCESDKLDEPPSGPCDVCRKCAYRRGAEAMREMVLYECRWPSATAKELERIIRALPTPEWDR